MRRKALGYFVRLALSALVLVVLASRVAWRDIPAVFGSIHAGWALASLGLLVAGTMVRMWSFMLVTNHRGGLVGFRQAAYLTLVGSAAALVLPSGAGELFKAHVAGKSLDAPEHLTVVSIIDKLTSLSAVAAMGVAGALVAGVPALALVSAAIFAVSTLAVFVPRLIPWRLATRVTALKAEVSDDELAEAQRLPKGLLVGVLAVSVLGWTVSYTMIYAVCRAFAAEVSFGYLLAIAPLVTLSTLLPLSVAGVGISQLTLVALLVRAGVAEQTAAHVALGQLTLSLLPPLAGLALYAAIGDRRWRTRADVPTASVAMLTTVYPRHAGDAVGTFIASAAEAVAAEGWRVRAVAPHAEGLAARETLGGVEVERFRYLPERAERLGYSALGIPEALRRNRANALALPFFALGFRRAARRAAAGCAVVHAHWAPVGAIAAASVGRTPLVLTLHGTDIRLAERGGVWLAALRYACRRAALVVPVSAHLAGRVRALVPDLGPERVRVIGNGIDPALLERVTAETDRDGIVLVGRLTEEKGALDAVRALARVPGDVRLTLVGGGDAAPVVSLARELGVADRVTLTGRLDRTATLDAIARAAVLVLPSRDEGFSVVTLEAAALGTPVVASDVGAIAEILGSDETLHAPGDVAALADRLERALTDRAYALGLAAAARARVAERYTWPAVARELIAAYTDATDVREVRE